jgi:hypothetical protein
MTISFCIILPLQRILSYCPPLQIENTNSNIVIEFCYVTVLLHIVMFCYCHYCTIWQKILSDIVFTVLYCYILSGIVNNIVRDWFADVRDWFADVRDWFAD